jgi:hypothetical protein
MKIVEPMKIVVANVGIAIAAGIDVPLLLSPSQSPRSALGAGQSTTP